VRDDRVRDAVEREPLHHTGHAEAVVPVEVRDEQAGDVGGGDPCMGHLPLGALAGVDEQALAVPAQQVPVVVALAGRDLARRPEHDQLTYGHGRGGAR
jgi:hypothetical protein